MVLTRKPCETCGRDMWAKRSDAVTCSARCRVARARRRKLEREAAEATTPAS